MRKSAQKFRDVPGKVLINKIATIKLEIFQTEKFLIVKL